MPTVKVAAASAVLVLRFVLGLFGIDVLDDNPDVVNGITALVAFGLAYLVPESRPAPSAVRAIEAREG